MTVNRPPVDALRKALEASTPGEWKWRHGIENLYIDGKEIGLGGIYLSADARFIARAHNDLPAILAYIEHLERLCGRAADTFEGFDIANNTACDLVAELRAVADAGEAGGESS